MERSKCRSCNAEIYWLENAETGRLAPIDAEPVSGGDLAFVGNKYHVVKGELYDDMLPGGRFVSHFATCAEAKKWREAKKGQVSDTP